jgi:hypothetical protein
MDPPSFYAILPIFLLFLQIRGDLLFSQLLRVHLAYQITCVAFVS